MLAPPGLSRLTHPGKVAGPGKTVGACRSEQGMTIHQTRTPGTCPPAGPPLGPPVDVVVWRARRLRDAGFAWDLADWLARTPADLHELLSLVDAGCPPQLAARILAPLDVGTGPW